MPSRSPRGQPDPIWPTHMHGQVYQPSARSLISGQVHSIRNVRRRKSVSRRHGHNHGTLGRGPLLIINRYCWRTWILHQTVSCSASPIGSYISLISLAGAYPAVSICYPLAPFHFGRSFFFRLTPGCTLQLVGITKKCKQKYLSYKFLSKFIPYDHFHFHHPQTDYFDGKIIFTY